MEDIAVEVLEQHAGGGTWAYDLENGQVWWSAGTYALHRLSPIEYDPAYQSSLALYEPESRERLHAAIEQAKASGDGWSLILSLRRADGVRRFVHSIGRVTRRRGQQPILAGAIIDVHNQTVERRARERDSAGDAAGDALRWRMAAESAGLSLFEIDRDRHRIRIVGVLAALVGEESAHEIELDSDDWAQRIPLEDRLRRAQRMDAHCAGALSFHVCEYTLKLVDGREVPLRETARYVNSDDGHRLIGTISDISFQVNAERAVRDSRERLEQTVMHAPIGMSELDLEGRWLRANHELCRTLGYTEAELRRMHFADLTVDEADVAETRHQARRLLAGEITVYRQEKRYRHRDGGLIDVQMDVSLLRGNLDEPLYFIAHCQNITERKTGQRALFDAKQMADVTFEAIGEGIIRVGNDGRILQVNTAACSLLCTEADDLIGQRFVDRVVLHDAGRDTVLADPVAQVFAYGERVRAPLFTRLAQRDGGYLSIVDSTSPIRDVHGRICGAVFVFRDVTEARRLTDELEYWAYHDVLTGLLNRRGFEQAIERLWPERMRPGMPCYVLCIDLDHFKAVNDLGGHAAGDEMLRQVAASLRSVLRKDDIVGRVGGDEFSAVVFANDDTAVSTMAERLIRRIRTLRLSVDETPYDGGASVGMARFSTAASSWQSVLDQADAALYVAKANGRNGFHLYGASDAQAVSYLNSKQVLQTGFDDDRFELFFQRIVNDERATLGFEALLRYQSDAAFITPDLFLPTARRLGLMSRLDCWVLDQALRTLAEARARRQWRDHWRLSVNLSPLTLSDPDFRAHAMSMLSRYATAASMLDIEVVESDELFGTHCEALIDDLRRHGVRIWLDDFARGYNGFDTLKRIEVDGIKIDRSFVQEIEHNPIDRAVLNSIRDVSQALAIPVTAEGVESDAIFETLKQTGFSRFQGFFFHEPAPAERALSDTPDCPQAGAVPARDADTSLPLTNNR